MIGKLFKGTYGESLIKKHKRKKDNKVKYDLCYELPNKKNNLEEMFSEEIREYAEINYSKNKHKFINNKEMRNLFEENIRKDLLALMILKDEIEQKIKLENYGISFISVLVTIITVIIKPTINGVKLLISILVLLSIYIGMAKRYDEKLNCINYSINILEDIKENIYFQKERESKEDDFRYRVDNLNSLNSFKKNKFDGIFESIKEDFDKNPIEVPENFEVEVKNLTDEKVESRRYSVKVKEILEDKSK